MRLVPRAALALLLSSAFCLPGLAQTPTDPVVVIELEDIPGDFAAARAAADIGRNLFLAGDYAQALEVLRPLADAGNPVAQNILGISLTELNEAYAPYDAATGFAYLLAASEQGFGPAMHNLGDTYQETHAGFAPDPEASYRWFRAAADLGYASAYFDTAYALVYGLGVTADPVAGRVWAEQALDGEDRLEVLGFLGEIAYFGLGQPRDFEQALAFYLQAAEEGSAQGALYAAYQYIGGEGTPVDDAAAFPLLQQAIAAEIPEAFAFLAEIHAAGEVPGADPAQAVALAMRGEELGDGYAATVLGNFHQYGLTDLVAVDLDAARAAYERGLALDDPGAAVNLGELAFYGDGEAGYRVRAYEYFQQAVELSPTYGYALTALAYMEMRGEGTERDIAAATGHLERALAEGSFDAFVEGIQLFGAPAYYGPQWNPVRALAHCLKIDAEGWPETMLADDLEGHRATCARLQASLSAEDQAAAAALAADF